MKVKIRKTMWGLERCGQEGQLLDNWDLSRGTLGSHGLLETHTLAEENGWERGSAMLENSLGRFYDRAEKLMKPFVMR